jgi:hypothetical protein
MHLTFFDVIVLIALAYLAFKVKPFYKFGLVDEETKAWEARMFGRAERESNR